MNYLIIIIIYYLLTVSAEPITLSIDGNKNLLCINDISGELKECDFPQEVIDVEDIKNNFENDLDSKLSCCRASDGSLFKCDKYYDIHQECDFFVPINYPKYKPKIDTGYSIPIIPIEQPCCHKGDGRHYTSIPPSHRCVKCGEYFDRTEECDFRTTEEIYSFLNVEEEKEKEDNSGDNIDNLQDKLTKDINLIRKELEDKLKGFSQKELDYIRKVVYIDIPNTKDVPIPQDKLKKEVESLEEIVNRMIVKLNDQELLQIEIAKINAEFEKLYPHTLSIHPVLYYFSIILLTVMLYIFGSIIIDYFLGPILIYILGLILIAFSFENRL